MLITINVMKEAERKYTYSQSQQISMQTGLIGYLRADMDSNGEGFFSTWNDFRKDLKTQEFKDEFDEVINTLRADGQLLHSRSDLTKFCYANPDSSFGNNREYGIRVDTPQYAYLMRLNPNKGEYNLYCYCYRRDWLDRHLDKAEAGIRFIDTDYNELFRIPDGGAIEITCYDDDTFTEQCRYIDETHVEVGNNLFHICEFAERMAQNGAIYRPEHGQADYYEIYQIEHIGFADYSFLPYDYAFPPNQQRRFKRNDYTRKYFGMLAKEKTLDDLFVLHNGDNRPYGDRMRSMSVSDVVVIHRDGKATAYYVNSIGFKDITAEFLP